MTARKPKAEINHKNADPTDNALDNVEITGDTAERLERAAKILAGAATADPELPVHPGPIILDDDSPLPDNFWSNPPPSLQPSNSSSWHTLSDERMLEDQTVFDRPQEGYRYRRVAYSMENDMPAHNTAAGQRPYLLESAVVEQTLRRQRDAALAEIEAVAAEMLSIETQANNEIADIQSRTATELAARTARKDDLQAIVDMASRALGPLAPLPVPSVDTTEQDRIKADLERRAGIGDEYREAIDKNWRAPE